MRQRILLLIVGALLPLALLTAGLGLFAMREQQDRLREEAVARAERTLTRVERVLETQTELLKALARSPTLDGDAPDAAAFHEVASRFAAEMPLWRQVILADAGGRQIVNTALPFGTPLHDVVDTDGHRRVLSEGRPVIGNVTGPGPLATGPLPTFGIRVPVMRDGAVAMAAVVTIRTEALTAILREEAPPPFRAFLIDGANRLVTATATPDRAGHPAGPRATEARATADGGVYDGMAPDGSAVVTAFRKSAATGWSAHVSIPLVVYRAPLVHSLWMLGVAALTALVLSASLVWLLRREIIAERRLAGAREQSNRLEALGRMTGGVAHDINNLLMVVQGNAELIRRRISGLPGGEDPRVARNLNAIITAVERGSRLTRDLLVFSRGGGGGTSATFDPAARIRAGLSMIRQSLRGDILLETDLSDGLAITADPVQFDVALLNLAVNARDAIAGVGTVRIAVRGEETAAGTRVAVSVSDTGAGIAADALPHVFEPFYTTKPVGKGSGLGLSQVYGFAKAAGGGTEIVSTPGAGTTVTVILPLAAASPPEVPAAPVADRDGMAPAARLLLVDDNADVRRVTADLLRDAGMDVVETADAASALERIATGGVDVLVSDIRMPGAIDGLTLARRVRECRPGLPVILVSGYSDLTAQARTAGFEVLAKPFDRTALLDAMRRAMDGAPLPAPAPAPNGAPIP
ncbi:response regulator [Azospirillum halopraeferens]|uniref:response regulator n=1 Tax=Azospirillum halopraeferens TaxID=34010 RepID=UPI000413E934|nr:response regulator [Azospirillum halopraeferens]